MTSVAAARLLAATSTLAGRQERAATTISVGTPTSALRDDCSDPTNLAGGSLFGRLQYQRREGFSAHSCRSGGWFMAVPIVESPRRWSAAELRRLPSEE